eukprot:802886-Rhodomonas_salina.1
MQGHTQVCTHCQSTSPETPLACLQVWRATLPHSHRLYKHASWSGELLCHVATHSTSMPPGRASYSAT